MRRRIAPLAVLGALALVAPPASAHQARIANAVVGAPAADTAPAGQWCGDERTTDDRTNEVAGSAHRLRALYLLPADAPSRLGEVAGRIQASVDGAAAIMECSRGRSLRFDRGTRCGPANVDITTVRLPLSTADLEQAALAGDTLDRVTDALIARGQPLVARDELFGRGAGTLNLVAWLDGAAPAGSCGQATMIDDPRRSARNDNAVGGKLALIFRDAHSFCGPGAVLHEVLHLLGAVQEPAPSATPDGHCRDVAEDIMCLPGSPAAGLGDIAVDAGSDDYWDPSPAAPLRWWTVNLSPFLCARARCAGDAPRARARAAKRALRRAPGRRAFTT